MIVELSSPNLHFKKKYGIIYVRGEKMDKLKERLFKTQDELHMISAYIKKISEEDSKYFAYFFNDDFKNKIYLAEEVLGDLIIYSDLIDEFKKYKKEQVKKRMFKNG